MFYKKDGVEYIKKGKQFYGGKIILENDMKIDNLDLILDLVDDYIDLVENCRSGAMVAQRPCKP